MSDADLVARLREGARHYGDILYERAAAALERLDADAAGEKAEKESLKLEVERLTRELATSNAEWGAMWSTVLAERDRLTENLGAMTSERNHCVQMNARLRAALEKYRALALVGAECSAAGE